MSTTRSVHLPLRLLRRSAGHRRDDVGRRTGSSLVSTSRSQYSFGKQCVYSSRSFRWRSRQLTAADLRTPSTPRLRRERSFTFFRSFVLSFFRSFFRNHHPYDKAVASVAAPPPPGVNDMRGCDYPASIDAMSCDGLARRRVDPGTPQGHLHTHGLWGCPPGSHYLRQHTAAAASCFMHAHQPMVKYVDRMAIYPCRLAHSSVVGWSRAVVYRACHSAAKRNDVGANSLCGQACPSTTDFGGTSTCMCTANALPVRATAAFPAPQLLSPSPPPHASRLLSQPASS